MRLRNGKMLAVQMAESGYSLPFGSALDVSRACGNWLHERRINADFDLEFGAREIRPTEPVYKPTKKELGTDMRNRVLPDGDDRRVCARCGKVCANSQGRAMHLQFCQNGGHRIG